MIPTRGCTSGHVDNNMENPVSRWRGFFVVCRFASLALNYSRRIYGVHNPQMPNVERFDKYGHFKSMYYVEHVFNCQSAN